jgi:hypothetical protein
MNITVNKKRPVPSVSIDKSVARLLLLGIGAASADKSSRLDHSIATVAPYEEEIADFEQAPRPESEDETWTDAKNQRRCDLIDRKYAGGLTQNEARELAWLQALMLRYRQRNAPLPIEAARRLYEELLAAVNESREPMRP